MPISRRQLAISASSWHIRRCAVIGAPRFCARRNKPPRLLAWLDMKLHHVRAGTRRSFRGEHGASL